MSDDFYIGYRDRAPDGSRRLLRAAIPVLALLLLASGVLFARAQQFDESRFEFGTLTTFQGEFRSVPAPHLLLDNGSALLLVGQGKSGAEMPVQPGSIVRLEGTRIIRGETVMAEVVPSTVETLREGAVVPLPVGRGQVSLAGEIVGSKCYLGVMNPAHGAVHRACARHCILGGVPAMFQPSSGGAPILITGLDTPTLLRLAARPVEVSGQAWQLQGLEWIELSDARLQDS